LETDSVKRVIIEVSTGTSEEGLMIFTEPSLDWGLRLTANFRCDGRTYTYATRPSAFRKALVNGIPHHVGSGAAAEREGKGDQNRIGPDVKSGDFLQIVDAVDMSEGFL
jgi:hypothetical protein